MAKREYNSPKLDEKGIKLIWSIIEVVLYIGRLIDMIILVTCNDIGIQ